MALFVLSFNLPPYGVLSYVVKDGKTYLKVGTQEIALEIFGKHNLMNLNAARLACNEAGVSDDEFYTAIQSFKGAAKRLEKLGENQQAVIYKDFAHSPSKLQATVEAVKDQFPKRKLIACIELHTFSSLNKDFLLEYAHTMEKADFALVFIDEKTFIQKNIMPFNDRDVINAFQKEGIKFFNQPEKIKEYILTFNLIEINLLLMSSGNFGGIDLVTLAKSLLSK